MTDALTAGLAFEAVHRWADAVGVYDRALADDLFNFDLLARRVALAQQHIDPEGAVAALQRAAAAAPDISRLNEFLACALLVLGRPVEAAAVFRRAIALEPALDLFETMVRGMMPGPNYRQHMSWLHELQPPRTYLEIGVSRGETLHLARPPTQAVGIDPDPLPTQEEFAAATRLFVMTSDAFFAPDHWHSALGDLTFELSFIDGLHLFEQVLRDFINVERHSTPQSTAVFHDTLPLVAIATEREVAAPFWCGDVWKIVPCLEALRPDLRIVTIPTPPSGLSIVTGLDPSSTVLADRFDQAVARFGALGFDWLEPRLPALLAAHGNGIATTAQALGRAA